MAETSMHLPIIGPANLRITSAAGGNEKRSDRLGVGLLAWSLLLHAIAFAGFITMLAYQSKSDAFSAFIPVAIFTLADETAGPQHPQEALVPEDKSQSTSSAAQQPVGGASPQSSPAPDNLDTKLHELAKLRLPSAGARSTENGTGVSHSDTAAPNFAPGAYATVKDFLRAEIERRWGPDLAVLGRRNLTVLLHVVITSAGVVRRADVVNNPNAGKDYDQIASSARNAVLLSSPFSLPPGHYPEVMDVMLSLNTAEALR